MLDRKTPPESHSLERFPLRKVQRYNTASGVPIFHINAGKEPIVRIELIFKAGSWYEEKNSASFFTARMLNEGTKKHTSAQIAETIAQYGAFTEVVPGNNRIIYTVMMLSKHVGKLLPLLEDIFTGSIFPEKELEVLKKITAQNLQVKQSKTSHLAQVEFRKLIFGPNHPYGRSLTLEDIASITRDDLQQHFDQHLSKENCEVLVAGDVNEALLSELDLFIERLNSTEVKVNPEYKLQENTGHTSLIEKEESLQSSIRMGRAMFDRTHPDYFDFLILNEVYGGYFGSRLMKNIREDKGYTYGIYSSIVPQQNGGHFIIATDVKKEVTQKAIDEIIKEMLKLKEERVGDEELSTVKNYLKGSFLNSINTAFSLADKFKAIHFFGLGYDYFDRYFSAVDLATPETVQHTAQQYFDVDSMIEVVAGGK